MGRIITQIKLTNFSDQSKNFTVSALVDTGTAYITLPNAWRDRLGEIEQLAEIEVEMADQSTKRGVICGPIRARVGEFRQIITEVLFLDMEPNEEGEYEPLVGYIALEQSGAAVDMLGHRLVHVKRVDLK